MTEPDVLVRRIRDAFERDLAGYQAPADLPQRARAGGLRRARGARRRLVTYGISATAAAAASAVVTAVVLAPQPGTSSQAAALPSPPSTTGPISSAGLPSAQSVGKAMLTAVDGVSDDILYSVSDEGGTPASRYQDWNWPAQPAVGQQARIRELFSEQSRGRMKPVEDFAFSYINRGPGPYQPPRKVPGQVTMVCYVGASGCGFNSVDVPAGTWTEFPLPPTSSFVSSDVSAGSLFSPAAIAQGITQGQWRVEERTQLGGRQALVLRETDGQIQPGPFVLWVDAQTYLPLKWTDGTGKLFSSGTYAYLPPTPANMALFKVPIPKGYPKSSPGNG
jgi:hypothetical protein